MADDQSDGKSIEDRFAGYLQQGEDLCAKSIQFYTHAFNEKDVTAEKATRRAWSVLEILVGNFKHIDDSLGKLQAEAQESRVEAARLEQVAKDALESSSRDIQQRKEALEETAASKLEEKMKKLEYEWEMRGRGIKKILHDEMMEKVLEKEADLKKRLEEFDSKEETYRKQTEELSDVTTTLKGLNLGDFTTSLSQSISVAIGQASEKQMVKDLQETVERLRTKSESQQEVHTKTSLSLDLEQKQHQQTKKDMELLISEIAALNGPDSDLQMWKNNYEKSDGIVKDLTQQLANIQGAGGTIETSKQNIERLQQEKDSLEHKLHELQQYNIKSTLEGGQIYNLRTSRNELQCQMKTVQDELETLRTAKVSMEQLNGKYDELNKKCIAAEKLASTAESVTAARDHLQVEYDSLKTKYTDLEKTASKLGDMTAARDHVQGKYDQLDKTHTFLLDGIPEINKVIAHRNELRGEYKELRIAYDKLVAKEPSITKLVGERDELRGQLMELQRRYDSLTASTPTIKTLTTARDNWQTRFENLQGKYLDVSWRLSTLAEKKASVDGRLSSFEGPNGLVEVLTKQRDELQQNYQHLQGLTGKVATLETRILELRQDADKLTNSLKNEKLELEKQFTALRLPGGDIAVLETAKRSLQEELVGTQRTITSLTNERDALQQELQKLRSPDGEIVCLGKTIEHLRGELDALTGSTGTISTLQAEKKELQEQVTGYIIQLRDLGSITQAKPGNEVDKLSEENHSLHRQVEELTGPNGRLKDLESQLGYMYSLQQSNEELVRDNSQLQQRIETTRQERVKSQHENEELASSKESLQQQLNVASSSNSELTLENERLQEDIDKFNGPKGEVAQLTHKVTELERELLQLKGPKGRIKELEGKVASTNSLQQSIEYITRERDALRTEKRKLEEQIESDLSQSGPSTKKRKLDILPEYTPTEQKWIQLMNEQMEVCQMLPEEGTNIGEARGLLMKCFRDNIVCFRGYQILLAANQERKRHYHCLHAINSSLVKDAIIGEDRICKTCFIKGKNKSCLQVKVGIDNEVRCRIVKNPL
ncbi:hypothetical protein VTL71DRAFT_9398 [Oculimacula yallundae]|uniref:Uncharacterized protein n=1 Tax=Oculimacula yallundae TaxID=86028 RepID=A0ABR4BU60_9HELO